MGDGDDGRAGARGEAVEHAEDGEGLGGMARGEVFDLVDDEEGGARADDEVMEAAHEEAESGPRRTVGDLEGELHLVGHGGLPEVF